MATTKKINYFLFLINVLYKNTLIALGFEKNPQTNKFEKDSEAVKLNYNILISLAEKTKNNLPKEETKVLNYIISNIKKEL